MTESTHPTLPDSEPQERAWYTRKWLLLAMIAVGIIIAFVMNNSKVPVVHEANNQQAVPAKIFEVQKVSIRPVILGYGEVKPEVLVTSRAEVAGRITYIHPELKKGAVIARDTLLMQIDERDYQLALRQAEASLSQSEANLRQQTLTLENTKSELSLVKDKLTIARKELSRLDRLFKQGSVSQSNRDNQRTAVLQLQQEEQSLTNNLSTLPQQIAVQQAQMEIAIAEVATQERNLARTRITLPFTSRITQVDSEANEFVSQGTTLFSAQTIDKVSVTAQFPLQQFRLLAKGFEPLPDLVSLENYEASLQQLIERLGLTASLRLTGDDEARWQGTVKQISNSLDPSARTLGVTISIANPYQNLEPGVKPPLIEGMFMEVQLKGPAQAYLVIPRMAVHEGEVYLAGADNRLQRRSVKGFHQGVMLLVDRGLEEGERLITSDLFPAVSNMLIQPIADDEQQAIVSQWLEEH